jgi:hypothetical protein
MRKACDGKVVRSPLMVWCDGLEGGNSPSFCTLSETCEVQLEGLLHSDYLSITHCYRESSCYRLFRLSYRRENYCFSKNSLNLNYDVFSVLEFRNSP